MGLLYRQDLDLLGYDVKFIEIRAKRLLSVVAYSELINGNHTIPCMATFFRFGNGVRIDYIDDNSIDLYEEYIEAMRQQPRHLLGYCFRLLVKMLTGLCIVILMITTMNYILNIRSPLTFEEFSRLYNIIVRMIICWLERYLVEII